MTKIYTKTGDDGTTFMPCENCRVSKGSLSVEVQGDLDELNAWIGMLRSMAPHHEDFRKIQVCLMELGAQFAGRKRRLCQEDIDLLERAIDQYELGLETLKHFILPATTPDIHIARAICRRAERAVVRWKRECWQHPPIRLQAERVLNDQFYLAIQYLNRLSDYLFVFARHVAKTDDLWISDREDKDQ